MVKFIIQTDEKGIPSFDFCWHLIKAIEYQKWYRGKDEYGYILHDNNHFGSFDPNIFIPIGSVEFVHSFLKTCGITIPKPVNIPPPFLNKFQYLLGRKVTIGGVNDIEYTSFVKSHTKVKGFTGIVDPGESRLEELIDDTYVISDIIELLSEWRIFVYNKEVVGVHQYLGSYLYPPNIMTIHAMISAWEQAPKTYTLDVGVTKDYMLGTEYEDTKKSHTVLIECHNFYSCGLYGFTDYSKLITMFTQWWYEYIKMAQEEGKIKF